jgi:hypothetical protein
MAETMKAAMAPRRITEATNQEEPSQAGHDDQGAEPLLPMQPVAEPASEDEEEEQQFGGEHGLDHTELPEAQGRGLQSEGDEHEAEADDPDDPPDGVRHQAEAHRRRLGGVLHPDALEDRGQSVDEGGERCQEVGHHSVVLANPQ